MIPIRFLRNSETTEEMTSHLDQAVRRGGSAAKCSIGVAIALHLQGILFCMSLVTLVTRNEEEAALLKLLLVSREDSFRDTMQTLSCRDDS